MLAVGATLAANPLGSSAATKLPTFGQKGYQPVGIQAQDPAVKGRWGERMAAAGDLNSDAVNDVWVGDPKAASVTTTSTNPAGKVYALDGAALGQGVRTVLYSLVPPTGTYAADINAFGTYIADVGDVNGDGVNDIAVGGTQTNGTATSSGKVWVFSGKASDHAGVNTGLLFTISPPAPQKSDSFATRITRAGDVNNDGIPDIMVSATTEDVPAGCSTAVPVPTPCSVAQGQVYIFSGKPTDAGLLLRTLDMPAADLPSGGCTATAPNQCHFGVTLMSPGDVNGDGKPDQVVDAGYLHNQQGRLYVYSGVDGALIGRIDSPVPQDGSFFGFADVSPNSPGDVNADGKADIYGGSFTQNDQGVESAGEAWVFSGASITPAGTPAATVLYAVHDPSPEVGGQFGWSMTTVRSNLGAIPAGTVPDLYVAQAPHHTANGGNGGSAVLDATNGTPKRALELPLKYRQVATGSNLGPAMGWSIAALGDINGDGTDDYLAGAPFETVGTNAAQGLVVAFLSGSETNVAAATGTDSALYVKKDGGGFQGLNGALIASPAVVAVPSGAITPPKPLYIGEGTDHRLYVRTDTLSWVDIAPGIPVGCFGSPAATITPDGAGGNILTVACTGGDRALYYWQTAVSADGLPVITSQATSLGGALIAGPAVAPVNSVLTFFAEGTDHFIYSKALVGGYTQVPAQCIGQPAAATNGVATFLACQGMDGSLYYSSNIEGRGWQPFRGAGGQLIAGPGIALTTAGMMIYVEGADTAVYHTATNVAATTSTAFAPDGGLVRYGVGATGPPA